MQTSKLFVFTWVFCLDNPLALIGQPPQIVPD